MKVLIVEPDKILQKTYKEALEESNNEVNAVANAQGALDVINIEIPDIIIMELELAKNSGFELIYEIRSYADLDKIKIVILSTLSEKVISKKIGDFKKDLNIYKYLYKPSTTMNKLIELTK